MLAAFFSSFWLQAGVLAAVIAAIELRGEPVRTWPARARRVAIEAVLWVALFAAISGGRGCAGSPPWEDEAPSTTTRQER